MVVAAVTLQRTYLCPICSYDGLKVSKVEMTWPDSNFQVACPRCWSVDGVMVLLDETSDPRGEAAA